MSYSVWKTCLYVVLIFVIFAAVPSVLAIEYKNPIEAKTFMDLVLAIADALVIIAVPLAIVAIIFTGFWFVIAGARGDEAGVKKARSMFLWVLIGAAIIVGASLLAKAVVNTIKSLG